MVSKNIDIKNFAERVERLCQFVLDKTERTGSNDLKIIEDLMKEAADIQAKNETDISVVGLADYMNGVPNESHT